jgi:hypothetical protein
MVHNCAVARRQAARMVQLTVLLTWPCSNLTLLTACSCVTPEPICNGIALVQSSGLAILVGTVTDTSLVLGPQRAALEVRRVQLEVTETFVGPSGTRVELFTGAGNGDCGYPFWRGRKYLVFASRNRKTGHWTTSICSRTAEIGRSGRVGNDLRTLRAWRKGAPLLPFIAGTVSGWRTDATGRKPLGPFSSVPISLSGEGLALENWSDADGLFRFDGLKPGIYKLQAGPVEAERAFASIDLSRDMCSETVVSVEETAEGYKYKVWAPPPTPARRR